jgi:hypothetical protein
MPVIGCSAQCVAKERMNDAVKLRSALLTSLVFATITAHAKAADVDWKLYTGTIVSKTEACFYDDKSVARTPERLIRVSTQCFSRKDLNTVDPDNDFGGAISKNAARKIQDGYKPPIGMLEKIDFDHSLLVAMYEEIANISSIQPQAIASYEFNCPQRTVRELSIDLGANGQRSAKNIPSNWRYVPSEGNEASLLKILCR